MNPPNNGPASLPVLSIPNIQLISRPRSLVAAPCEIAANRPITHICAAQPMKKRRTNSSGNEWANTTSKAIAEVSSGPAIITGRRPKRSINQPDGIVPARFPSRNAVTTPLATPKLTSKDFAKVGTAGSAMPVPSANTSAGKYVERNASHEIAACLRDTLATAGSSLLSRSWLSAPLILDHILVATIASRHRHGGASQSRRSRDTVLHIAELRHVSLLKTLNARENAGFIWLLEF